MCEYTGPDCKSYRTGEELSTGDEPSERILRETLSLAILACIGSTDCLTEASVRRALTDGGIDVDHHEVSTTLRELTDEEFLDRDVEDRLTVRYRLTSRGTALLDEFGELLAKVHGGGPVESTTNQTTPTD